MAALPRYVDIRRQVLEDARLGTGYAHLESPDVPEWIQETGDHDIVGTLSEALSNAEGKRHETLCDLLTQLCRQGDDIAQRKAVDLLDTVRALLTDHCIADAQRMVDRELS